MGLGNIIKKSESLGKKSLKTFLKINKYDNPSNAMDLIGHICTAAKDIDFQEEFYSIFSLLFEMEDERGETFNWGSDLYSNLEKVLLELERTYLDNTYQLKIAVSGGYSAGKSTFMNMLIGKGEFLPTDMNPTSLVNTYLNFNGSISNPVVRGENINNNLVLLDEDVLASIRHDTQNAKAIANILKRLIIDIPCESHIDGITFIDTPGYDNSMDVNRENNTTDKDTAAKAFKEADVIFWCANIGKQVTNEDLNFIKENGGEEKPVVILLSRMRSKAPSEIASIVNNCHETAKKHLKNVIDVIAYDRDASLDEIYSKNRNTISQLFSKIKSEHQESVLDICSFIVEDCFEEEMKQSQECYAKYKNEYDEVVKKLNEARKDNSNLKSNSQNWISDLNEVLINSYNGIDSASDKMIESSKYALDSFVSFYNGVMNFENNDHWGTSSILNSAIRSAESAYDRCVNKHNAALHAFDGIIYNEEWRRKLVDHFRVVSDALVDQDIYDVDYFEERKKKLSEGMSKEKTCQKCINKYQPIILSAIEKADGECREKRNKHYKSLDRIENVKDDDIFSAISGNNMERFVLCFHTGVELSLCNSQGFNVLTWLVTFGNAGMLDFVLKHKDFEDGVDLTIRDKNGMNIMEAAIMAHNKQACVEIIKVLPNLKPSRSIAEQMMSKNDFNSWIKAIV